MGFGFRKTFSSGPFRFTVYPSGVSSSFGVRGARISSGPRGTFVTVSSHGVYYRHRIDGQSAGARSDTETRTPTEQPVLDSVFQVPVTELIASNQSDLVAQLNENVSATNPAILLVILSCLALFIVPTYPIGGITTILIGLVCSAVLSSRFKAAHTHEIHYSLDDKASTRFAAIQNGLAVLSSCSYVWTLNTQSSTYDLKRSAGAGTLVTRKPVAIGKLPTPGFRPSIPISSIAANGTAFHFLPDQVLIFSGGKYASIGYEQLNVNVVPTRFVEADQIPSDSTQVDTTWRFVNKGGGPDRRFNDNRQIPILRYGEVTLTTAAGLRLILQASNFEKAAAFAFGLQGTRPAQQRPYQQTSEPPPMPANADGTLLQCYTLLGITRPTTLEQASAAHRHQAMLYHPDKYEHLAPETKAIAAARMQEINAAFARIKLDIGV